MCIRDRTRGIGKGTLDTLERVALETGLSLWGALAEAIRRQLLPQRALSSLESFRQLIEDGRAMLAGSFNDPLAQSVGAGDSPAQPEWGQPLSAVPVSYTHLDVYKRQEELVQLHQG